MAFYRVKKSFNGSPDGIQVIHFIAGSEVELTGDLERVALEERWVLKPRKKTVSKPADNYSDGDDAESGGGSESVGNVDAESGDSE